MPCYNAENSISPDMAIQIFQQDPIITSHKTGILVPTLLQCQEPNESW